MVKNSLVEGITAYSSVINQSSKGHMQQARSGNGQARERKPMNQADILAMHREIVLNVTKNTAPIMTRWHGWGLRELYEISRKNS